MNINQLEYFVTIAKRKNFTLAAERLNATQSTLSHSMKNLEEKLGVVLFDRNNRKVQLTMFGEIFLEYAELIISLYHEATAKLEDMSNPDAGLIAISYFSSLNDLVTYAVSSYYTSSGKIQPHFRFFPASTTEIEKSIINDESDLAFTTEIANPKFEYFQIGSHETVVVVSKNHPLSRFDSIHLSQIDGEKLITYEYSCQIRSYIDLILSRSNSQPKVIFETTNDHIILSSVAANFGVAIIPKPLNQHISTVKTLSIIDDIPARSIALAWKKSKYLSKAAENFISFVTENKSKLNEFLRQTMRSN